MVKLLTVKHLKKGDWDTYKQTLRKLESSAFPAFERTNKWVFREFINQYTPYTAIFYYGKVPVGYYLAARLEVSSDNHIFKRIDREYGKNNTLYLFNFGVHKDYQRLGIGQKMFDDLLKVSKRRFDRISLHTRNKNMIRLCYRKGFRILDVEDVLYKIMKKRYKYMAKWLKNKK